MNMLKTKENRPKMGFTQENSRQRSRESSIESYTSEQNRDTIRLNGLYYLTNHSTYH